MIEVNPEDQYAIVSGDVGLEALRAALPATLQYRAPNLNLSVEDWLLAGGFGLLEAAPVRRDVLGLEYRGAHGSVKVGGVVVKNVAGYDLRLVVGSDPSLQKQLRVERATLRLRPRVSVTRLEVELLEAELSANFAALRQLGAAYAYAAPEGALWRLQAEFWGKAPAWGQASSGEALPVQSMCDVIGAFPRPPRAISELERRVLEAL